MYTIHVHAEEGGEHGKVKGNTPLEKDDCLRMVHESWCHVKPCLTLNKQLQKGQGKQGRKGEDRMTDIRRTLCGCGKQNGKWVDKPKEGEGTGRSKLRRMGMMSKWIYGSWSTARCEANFFPSTFGSLR